MFVVSLNEKLFWLTVIVVTITVIVEIFEYKYIHYRQTSWRISWEKNLSWEKQYLSKLKFHNLSCWKTFKLCKNTFHFPLSFPFSLIYVLLNCATWENVHRMNYRKRVILFRYFPQTQRKVIKSVSVTRWFSNDRRVNGSMFKILKTQNKLCHVWEKVKAKAKCNFVVVEWSSKLCERQIFAMF